MKRYAFALFSALIFLQGCAALPPTTQEDRDYLSDAAALYATQPIIPESEIKDAWARAQVFLNLYGELKIQTATDYALNTYNPIQYDARCAFAITKVPIGDGKYKIALQCYTNNIFCGSKVNRYSQIAYYYILTGKIRPYLLNRN
jgi:hypothetical protein